MLRPRWQCGFWGHRHSRPGRDVRTTLLPGPGHRPLWGGLSLVFCPQLHGAQSCMKSRSSFPSVEPVHAVPPRGPVPARPPGVGRHSGRAGSWGAGGAGGRTIHQAECHLGFLSPSQLCPQAPQFCPRGRHKGTLLLSGLRCPRGLRSSRASPPWTPHLPLPWLLGESPYSANSYHVISPCGFWGSSPL